MTGKNKSKRFLKSEKANIPADGITAEKQPFSPDRDSVESMENGISGETFTAEKSKEPYKTPEEYLSDDKEDMPDWLASFKKGDRVDIQELFSSRILFNPGAGTEGSPIRVFNKAHAVHVFMYVDYGYTEDEIDRELSDRAFLGYHLIHEERISPKRLTPKPITYHLTEEELREIAESYKWYGIPTTNRFCILKIYERDAELGDGHGAARFAIVYVGGDAIAAYDAIFGNTDRSPFACVIENYGFSLTYSPFGAGSYLEKIALRSERLPKYLLCAENCDCWAEFVKLRRVGGTDRRFLWRKKRGENNT